MITFREYFLQNGHDDAWIDENVTGLIDINAPIGEPIEATHLYTSFYAGNGWILYANNSGYDILENTALELRYLLD